MSCLVWFKRDLRLTDHAAVHAARQLAPGQPLRGLYIAEPGLWALPDAAAQHWAFVRESLLDLGVALRSVGGELAVDRGEATAVLERHWQARPFDTLLSHEETGNDFTFQRDIAVARWCRERGVRWQEWPQFGVVRRLRDRDHWHRQWQAFMSAPTWDAPAEHGLADDEVKRTRARLDHALPTPADLGLDAGHRATLPPARQRGGRLAALGVLHDFLHERCGQYRGGISSPLSAPTACSRLSPYLAHGCLGAREVVQATAARMAELQALDCPEAQRQRAGLSAFMSRMHWHCHFIQKLESEPALEWRNLHRGYDGLREGEFNHAHFDALIRGRTGWPMVDACVAMLRHTGWVNFRMRAMLVSVASYPLWLHWRPVGEWLATQFLDYEPGIHWSQMQMQAGTTGINTTRVYNPIKQAHDHDPHGHFVRRWLPALRRVPQEWLFEPWKMPPELQASLGLRVGSDAEADIPLPLVDLAEATRTAKSRVHGLRAQPEVKAAKAEIVRKHGSRTFRNGKAKAKAVGQRAKADAPEASAQRSLDF